ncbi:MAG: hypothetical protein ACK45H_12900 [Bacteroidota bacterium]|jgi:hypothetical protein
MIRFIFCFTLLLTCANVYAQADTTAVEQQDTTLYRIVKTDGTEILGYILKQDERELLVKTKDGRKILIPQYIVKEIIPVKSGDFSVKGEFVGEDAFATRYFITTNGLAMKKGQHYIQWNLFGPDFQFSVTDKFGLGLMTSWVALPIIGTAKYSFNPDDKVKIAIGGLLGTSSWAAFSDPDFNFGGALPFATVSFGDRRRNLALSGGYGAVWFGSQSEGSALSSVAGMIKVSAKFSLVFDSFIIMPGGERQVTIDNSYFDSNGNYVEVISTKTEKRPITGIFIPGLRWHQGEGKAFQFGFTGIYTNRRMVPIPIPMVQWYRSL